MGGGCLHTVLPSSAPEVGLDAMIVTTQAHWKDQVFGWVKTVGTRVKPGFWLSSVSSQYFVVRLPKSLLHRRNGVNRDSDFGSFPR
jgi:hypothetical protein